MKVVILWIEGRQQEGLPFITALRKKGHQVEVVSTGNEAVARLPALDPDLVIVDAASLRTNGKRICSLLRKQSPKLSILLIGRSGQAEGKDDCANVILSLPFTARKLINRMGPLLPEESDQMLHVGPIRLDLEKRKVTCQGREAKLTPRLVTILRIMMEHHGEVVERKALFQRAWNTDYTGDTRTLDVHVSWLRQAIEEDPRKPDFLKTIRGVGYRLDA
jgi:DNA-binding response OmpR family regulator